MRIALLLLFWTTTVWAAGLDESTLAFGRFDTVHLYRQSVHPAQVVLFVSGDGGWKLGVVDMARELAGLDALVVGIDIIHFLKVLNSSGEGCLYPAADFESLSKYVQKRLDYPNYIQPVLAGYSSGATLVYAVLAQAPANTFKAAISMGFCPDLPLARPPCKAGLLEWTKDPQKEIYYFLPVKQLDNPWVAFQGDIDQVCDAEKTRAFVSQIAGGEIVMLPKVGHGFSVPKNWLPQFKQTFARLTASQKRQEKIARVDLPVVEVPAGMPAKREMAVLITGDGGWAGFDRKIAGELAAHGVGVVALDSLKYFWTARTPDGAARDLTQLLEYYLGTWHKEKAVLIGYSLGADVLPFMAARLPADIRRRVAAIALLAPGRQTAFEFHLSDWVGGSQGVEYPTGPEVDKLTDLPLLCFYGKEESDSLCLDRLPPNATVIPMAGAHHLGGDYTSIVGRVLQAMERP
jgi:type IV secretory pathway VirJ component